MPGVHPSPGSKARQTIRPGDRAHQGGARLIGAGPTATPDDRHPDNHQRSHDLETNHQAGRSRPDRRTSRQPKGRFTLGKRP
jgi:hypothetical protein